MCKTMTRISLSVILISLCLAVLGCDERDWGCGRGCYRDWSGTDVDVGLGFWASGLGYGYGDGYTEVSDVYSSESYGYSDYYYDGYSDCAECAWKTKQPDRRR